MIEKLREIRQKGFITTEDNIILRTIQDVIGAFFTNEVGQSKLYGNYNIDKNYKVFFPCFEKESKIEDAIDKGYCVSIKKNNTVIELFDNSKNSEKKYEKYKKEGNYNYVVFGKSQEKEVGIGFHFWGVFKWGGFSDEDNTTAVFELISKEYKFI